MKGFGQMELAALQATLAQTGGKWQAGDTFLSQLSMNQQRYRLGYVPGPNEASLAQRRLLSAQRISRATIASTAQLGTPSGSG